MNDPARQVHDRLRAPDLPSRVRDLGFRAEDVPGVLAAAATVTERPEDEAALVVLVERLVRRIGDFDPDPADSVWSGPQVHSAAVDDGVLPMLALLVSAPEVGAFHLSRGVDPAVSAATLADLGQQVFVHRLAFGRFGLHTHGWLALIWSGALYRLGRLQFNLQRDHDRTEQWVLSTHIPRSGPLSPAAVDQSFAAAVEFFANHFPDYPTHDFWCESWLLDPALPELLPGSNLAAFQRRWVLSDDRHPGEADVLFFVFDRRDQVEPSALPVDTALRRAAVQRLSSAQGWSVCRGRLAQATAVRPR